MQANRGRSANYVGQRGLTLIEMIITVAIISILAGIAIPLYDGYVTEGHFTSIRTSINSMRVPIEDFRLENGNYGGVTTLVGEAAIDGRFGWEPGSDVGAYTYTVAVVSTGNYHVWGTFGTDVWVRCENRQSNCCDSDTAGATAANAACP